MVAAQRVQAPVEEIRLAVVLNGGVSLAVWMGGVVQELNRLTWASAVDPYATLLGAVDSAARADVIAGTSAGGINGAALALGQVNSAADLSQLRGLWVEQGRIDALLRTPFRGQPTSLLQGDEFFLGQLDIAMAALSASFTPTERLVDLTLATTLLDGVQDVTVDVLGQRIPDVRYDGRFHFSSEQLGRGGSGPALALAARCSAGFPLAFEPCYVPVRGNVGPLKPDMEPHASWAVDHQVTPADRSRFAVDGGLLANTPTRNALDGIARMPPPNGPTRRVMLLVHPHAPQERPEVAARPGDPPTVTDALGGLMAALSGQGSRNFVEEIDAHNRNAAAWRDGRTDVLTEIDSVTSLAALVDELWPHYRRLRRRQVRNEWVDHALTPQDWSTQRIRSAVTSAYDAWATGHGEVLPFLPKGVPGPDPAPGPGWPWGVGMAIAVVDEVGDLARRAFGVACTDSMVTHLQQVQTTVVDARVGLAKIQDDFWCSLSAPATGEPDVAFWDKTLQRYTDGMSGKTGDDVRELVYGVLNALEAAAPELCSLSADPARASAGLKGWSVLLNGSPDSPELLKRLMQLEVVTAMVADADRLRSTQPIDLVQLSLRTPNWFAEQTRGGEGKLAGQALHRFGGFLKRSWRVNDWLWGRIDAATILTRIVLSPDRLLRLRAAGGGTLDPDAVVDTITAALYPEASRPAAVKNLEIAARQELHALFDGPADGPPASLPALADYVAARLHVDIVLEELPLLASAIHADRVEGADPSSRGELFLATNGPLLTDIRTATGDQRLEVGVRALKAFDAAGIGRESLEKEAASDQLIRTAATTAAVTATLIDSDRSGLSGAAKPVTRALRGVMLLPYWVITGLTAGGAFARVLAYIGLTIGGVLLTLSLLGLLSGASSAGALIGIGAILTALAYSAMRSGTLLHGLVLLGPVAPLVVIGLSDLLGTTSAATTRAASTALIVLCLVAALIILGSLPSPVLSPAATACRMLHGLAKPDAQATERGAGQPADRQAGRGVRVVFRLLSVLAPAVAVVLVGVAVVRSGLGPAPHASMAVVIVVFAGLAIAGGAVAWRTGAWLRLRTKGQEPDPRRWTTTAVAHPAGVSAGWSVVYGIGYALLAAWAFWWAPDRDSMPWRSLAIGSAVISIALLTVAPVWFPSRARHDLSRRLASDVDLLARLAPPPVAAAAGEEETPATAGQAPTAPSAPCPEDVNDVLLANLIARGATYSYLTEVTGGGAGIELSAAGADLAAALRDQVRYPRTSLPVSVHLTMGGVAMIAAAVTDIWMNSAIIPAGQAAIFAAIGALLAAAAGVVEGWRARPGPRTSFGAPGLGAGVLGGLCSVLTAIAVPIGWVTGDARPVLAGAAAGVVTVGLQLLIAVVVRRRLRLRRQTERQTDGRPRRSAHVIVAHGHGVGE